MLLQAHTGSQNLPEGMTKLHLFFVPTRRHAGQEAHISALTRGINPEVRVTATNKVSMPAVSGAPLTLGEWHSANYEVPEGVVFKVFGTKRQNYRGQQLTTHTASMYIQMRPTAALNSIDFSILEHARSPIQRATIQGRFDILEIPQAAQLGISLQPQFLGQLRPDKVARLFTIRELERQIEAQVTQRTVTVRNSDGDAVVLQKTVARRAVKL